MSQLKAPKPLPEKRYEEVRLVYDRPEWVWKVPTRFSFKIQTAFNAVPANRCFNWLREELNKQPSLPISNNGSAIVRRENAVVDGIGMALASTARMLAIPSDEEVQKHIDKFYRYKNVETLKQQLDIICTPLAEGTPLASAVVESGEADEDVVESIFDFLFATVNPPDPLQKDSGQEENSSVETTPLKEVTSP